MERAKAWELLRAYNKDHFHLQHALTVEAVMRWFANDLGYGAEADYWGVVGLLHDIDFELYPEQHCVKCVELLQKGGVPEDMIHAIVSHGYGICADVAPEREMEKVLFACDELTGLIWAAALMRPSKSTKDMELKSLKKKYKDKGQIFHGIEKIDAEIISSYDLIVITAAHTNIDYDMIQQNAAAIFDTRNAMKDIADRENIEVL